MNRVRSFSENLMLSGLAILSALARLPSASAWPGLRHQCRHGSHVDRYPFAVDGRAAGVALAALQVQRVDGAGVRAFDGDAARAVGHGRLDVAHGRVGDLVLGVDGGAFHLGEAQAAAFEGGVAVGFQEGGGLLHAGLN
jgi:hypothetical protein